MEESPDIGHKRMQSSKKSVRLTEAMDGGLSYLAGNSVGMG